MSDAAIEARVRGIVVSGIVLTITLLVGWNVSQVQAQQMRATEVRELGGPLLTVPEIGGALALVGVAIVLTEYLRRKGSDTS